MSAAVHTAIRAGIKRIHLIAPTTADFHDVNVEGKSGISNLYFTSHASTEYKASPDGEPNEWRAYVDFERFGTGDEKRSWLAARCPAG